MSFGKLLKKVKVWLMGMYFKTFEPKKKRLYSFKVIEEQFVLHLNPVKEKIIINRIIILARYLWQNLRTLRRC